MIVTIEATVIGVEEEILTETGRFDTVVIQYSILTEIPVLAEKTRSSLTTIWLAKEVGLIQIESPNHAAQLVKFKIIPVSVSPKAKIFSTWGEVKAQ